MLYLRTILVFSLLLSTSLAVHAADLGQVKADMKARQALIEALWADGMIGENNQGFVTAREDLSPKQRDLVEAENTDRRTVYRAIARSTESTPEQVGTQRAVQISKRAAKGLWLQDATGQWYRK